MEFHQNTNELHNKLKRQGLSLTVKGPYKWQHNYKITFQLFLQAHDNIMVLHEVGKSKTSPPVHSVQHPHWYGEIKLSQSRSRLPNTCLLHSVASFFPVYTQGRRLNWAEVLMPRCTAEHYVRAKSRWIAKHVPSAEYAIYTTSLLRKCHIVGEPWTCFAIKAPVLVESIDRITFPVPLNIFVLILPTSQTSVRSKQKKKHHLKQDHLFTEAASHSTWHELLLSIQID